MENLKFRIWDYDNEGFDFIDLFEIEKTIETLDSIRDYFSSDYLKANKDFIQKHTGLKDNNESAIYEGDIDKSGNVIKWNPEKAMFALYSKEDRLMSWPLFGKELEVIGNIHENPELLK